MPASATLPSLLWAVLGELERAYAYGWTGVPLDLWANFLRAVNEIGTHRHELPVILRLSKRAVRSRISTAARHGWVEELALGRSQSIVRLTARGSDVAARCKSNLRAGEERWCVQTGVDLTDKLRASLEEVVSAFPLEHPHYPASYGSADASITGGNGQDWKAVPRLGGDTVSDLPLSALVSQILVAFAMSYEQKSPVAFSLSTSIIRHIPAAGKHWKLLNNSVGVSALVRHGFLRVTDEMAYLTPKGFAVSSAHDDWVQAVESEWRSQFGQKTLAALRQGLHAVTEKMSSR